MKPATNGLSIIKWILDPQNNQQIKINEMWFYEF